MYPSPSTTRLWFGKKVGIYQAIPPPLPPRLHLPADGVFASCGGGGGWDLKIYSIPLAESHGCSRMSTRTAVLLSTSLDANKGYSNSSSGYPKSKRGYSNLVLKLFEWVSKIEKRVLKLAANIGYSNVWRGYPKRPSTRQLDFFSHFFRDTFFT